jgi:hypothetical protein
MMHHRKSKRGTRPVVPLWWRNALRAWELALAAPEVVAHRTARMAVAGRVPSARDQKEFTRMGQEKVEALAESLSAMALPMYKLNQELALLTARQWQRSWQWWSAWSPLASLATSRSPAQLTRAQAVLMREIASAAGDKRLADAFSRVLQKGLAPVHRRATRNAKRLRSVKARKKR